LRKTSKRWSDDIVEWCGCSLVEAVQLASDEVRGERWRELNGFNSSHGPRVAENKEE